LFVGEVVVERLNEDVEDERESVDQRAEKGERGRGR
jgi:hypothetical protein